jgi:AAA domain
VARPRKKPERQKRCKSLIYGPPKHGKTHFLGTAAFDERTAPMALIDFEGGVLDVLEDMPGFGTNLIHIPVFSWDDFNEAYARIYENDEGFKSFGVDSLSETHIFALMELLEDGRPSREANPDLIEQGDYGTGLVQLRRLVRKLRDLPMHGFYTAHHKEDVDRKEGTITTVNLAGKAAVEIPGLMTVVAYLALSEVENGEGEIEMERLLLLQNYAKIRIGVRAGWGNKAPDEIEDPTVTKLLDALKYVS